LRLFRNNLKRSFYPGRAVKFSPENLVAADNITDSVLQNLLLNATFNYNRAQ
jgi:hypothetical protein